MHDFVPDYDGSIGRASRTSSVGVGTSDNEDHDDDLLDYVNPPQIECRGQPLGLAAGLRPLRLAHTLPPPTHPFLVKAIIPLRMAAHELGVHVSHFF